MRCSFFSTLEGAKQCIFIDLNHKYHRCKDIFWTKSLLIQQLTTLHLEKKYVIIPVFRGWLCWTYPIIVGESRDIECRSMPEVTPVSRQRPRGWARQRFSLGFDVDVERFGVPAIQVVPKLHTGQGRLALGDGRHEASSVRRSYQSGTGYIHEVSWKMTIKS